MTATRIDGLVMLALAGTTAAILVIILHHWPRAALAAWLMVLAFVPSWLSLHLIIDVPPAAAMGLVSLAALLPVAVGRLVWADALVAFLMLACLIPFVIGVGSFPSFVAVLILWLPAFLLGRLAPLRIGLDRTYRWVAGVFTVVAACAVVEFAVRWNPFIALARPSEDYATWGELQARGGLVRAEWAFGHSIALGASLALAIPITLACSWSLFTRLAMTLTLLAGTLLTLSRTAILCAALGLLLTLLLPSETRLSPRARAAGLTVTAVGAVACVPWILGVFSDAGDEAAGSATYRLNLLSLLPRVQALGGSDWFYTAESSRFLAAGSIDNAWLLLGLRYGALPLAIATILLIGAVTTVALRRATPATIAIVAHLPALFTVALITQYEMWFWFVVGLATSGQAAASAHARARANENRKAPIGAIGKGRNIMSGELA